MKPKIAFMVLIPLFFVCSASAKIIDVTFTYYISDPAGISYCALYTTTSGAWKMDDITPSVQNGAINNFTLPNINEGTYQWNIKCEDNSGNAAFLSDRNWTFTVSVPTILGFGPESQRVNVGDEFSINITIKSVENLYAIMFNLTYNPEVLEFVSITPSEFLGTGAVPTVAGFLNESGMVSYIETRIGDVGGVSGDGVIAQVTFRAITIGTDILQYTYTELRNSSNEEIVHNTASGTVEAGAVSGKVGALVADSCNTYCSTLGYGNGADRFKLWVFGGCFKDEVGIEKSYKLLTTCCCETSKTKGVALACSGNVKLKLKTSAILYDTGFNLYASGLSSCQGKTVWFGYGSKNVSCATGKLTGITNCVINSSGMCTAYGKIKTAKGEYKLCAKINKNGDGDYADSGETSGIPILVLPRDGTYIGAFILNDPIVGCNPPYGDGCDYRTASKDTLKGKIQDFENIVGKEHVTYLFYRSMTNAKGTPVEFPTNWVNALKELGAIPQIGYEPKCNLRDVTESNLLPFARAAKNADIPILLRYASEMNGNCWGITNGAQEYIKKFRLVHDIFEREAPNVMMVWGPSIDYRQDYTSYYPGDDYVDWIGVSMYYRSGSQITPFSSRIRNIYKFSVNHKKPLIIQETAASCGLGSNPGGSCSNTDDNYCKARMTNIYNAIKNYPNIKAVTWLSTNQKCLESLTNNTLLLNTYKSKISDSYYTGTYQ